MYVCVRLHVSTPWHRRILPFCHGSYMGDCICKTHDKDFDPRKSEQQKKRKLLTLSVVVGFKRFCHTHAPTWRHSTLEALSERWGFCVDTTPALFAIMVTTKRRTIQCSCCCVSTCSTARSVPKVRVAASSGQYRSHLSRPPSHSDVTITTTLTSQCQTMRQKLIIECWLGPWVAMKRCPGSNPCTQFALM